jgi:hypothetical protein
MLDDKIFEERTDVEVKPPAMTTQKWGGLASFLLAVAYLVPQWIYLTGNLEAPNGPLVYNLADFLFGPVWAASLVTAVYALRERMGERAQSRMTLAFLAAMFAAAMMVSVASIRSANRYYHLLHPELNLQMSTMVLTVWTTLVAGISSAGWHFLGWAFVLIGSAGWTTRRLPRVLNVLYLVVGVVSLFVYLRPDMDASVVVFGTVITIWQGILLWTAEPEESQASKKIAGRPDNA